MSFQTDKQSVFNLVRAKNCSDLRYVQATTSYTELASLLFRFASNWPCLKDYLESLLSVFTADQLHSYNILFNETVSTVNNYVFVAKATITTALNLNTGGTVSDVMITGDSTVERIVVSNSTEIEYMVVAAGSLVKFIEIQPGSKINYIEVRTCNGTEIAEIKNASGSLVALSTEEGGIFGGMACPTDASSE